jgi:hypothetical protein
MYSDDGFENDDEDIIQNKREKVNKSKERYFLQNIILIIKNRIKNNQELRKKSDFKKLEHNKRDQEKYSSTENEKQSENTSKNPKSMEKNDDDD